MMRDFHRPGRSVALAERAMAATSHPMATLAALDVLRSGGNALDAAIAAVALQCVVEPAMTGIGGDCFCLIGQAGEPVAAFNGSGRAPAGAALERVAADAGGSLDGSVHAVTVPGAVDAWQQLLDAHGSRGLDELLGPAIRAARDGFPVTPRAAYDWALDREKLHRSEAASTFYLPGGRPPETGDRIAFPALARTLEQIARLGRDAFYEGPLAEAMVHFLKSQGGLHTLDDFAQTRGETVAPISTTYRGLEVVECPPNGQGITTLVMLNILERFDSPRLDPDGAERLHLMAEAGRLAYRDRDAFVADPAMADVPARRLLDKEYASRLANLIDPQRAMAGLPPPLLPAHPDTVYVTVVDQDRMVVSFINSIFDGFGSGLVCPATGVLFHSRGRSFSLDPAHPNCIAPGKRPLHTIIPALALRDGQPVIGFGVMGGHYQPMGQVHTLTGVVDFGQDPQEAIDAPRVLALGGEMQVERGVRAGIRQELERRGHRLVDAVRPLGGGQMILIDEARGVLLGGSDPRKDGLALGY